MAATGQLSLPAARRPALADTAGHDLRIAIVAAALIAWEALAASGLLYRDVGASARRDRQGARTSR